MKDVIAKQPLRKLLWFRAGQDRRTQKLTLNSSKAKMFLVPSLSNDVCLASVEKGVDRDEGGENG